MTRINQVRQKRCALSRQRLSSVPKVPADLGTSKHAPFAMTEVSGQRTARLACHACRRQMRKCNREVPACELCAKNRRRCEYPADALDWLGDVSVADSASSLVSGGPRPRPVPLWTSTLQPVD